MSNNDFLRWLKQLENRKFFYETPFGSFDFAITPLNVYLPKQQKKPIKADEVLAFTKFINNFDGRISEWLQTNDNYDRQN